MIDQKGLEAKKGRSRFPVAGRSACRDYCENTPSNILDGQDVHQAWQWIHSEDIWFWLIRFLIIGGIGSFLYFMSWWLDDGRFRSPGLFFLWMITGVYGGIQLVGNWILYLKAHRPLLPSSPTAKLSVDVFVTVYDESVELVEQALTAGLTLYGPHQTWLLDDGPNPELKTLAAALGAGYLTRPDRVDAKAGNLNAALARTSGDIAVIFDVDHIPRPDFLDQTLGYFTDPAVGFVQAMLTFDNGEESWVAKAAMETSLEYYNPTSLGADGIGGATLMGSNALIRRSALNSIGGYQPGLAEDLATSLALHAAGWRSAYVPEPLAPGLAPPTFTAWFNQQMKWARGVFELLQTVYPRVFTRLSWGQRLSYAVRMTKYWIGPVVCLHLLATIVILMFAGATTRAAFHEYLHHIALLAVFDILIRFAALRKWRHSEAPHTSLFRAVILVYATWPIYTLSWLMACLRLPLAFRPTPKGVGGAQNPAWLLPQSVAVLLLAVGIASTVFIQGHPPSLLLLFATLQAVLQLLLLKEWLCAEKRLPSASTKKN